MTPEKENKKGGSRLRKGDGRASAPANPPKGAKSPRPEKTKRRLTTQQKVMRGVYIGVTVIAALVVAIFIASRFLFVKPTVPAGPNRTPPPRASGALESEDPGAAPDTAEMGRKDNYFTFLIAGRDTGGGGNTDVIMVVSYDVANQELNVMNIPRDTMVNKSWDIKKINSVYNYGGGKDGGGIDALKETVGDTVGFVPDFYIIVEWEAVGRLATAIGGVEFDVPLNMNYDDPTQDLHIHVSKGYQHLDGEQVMQVLRFRKNNDGTGYVSGDIGRIEVQQELLMAIAEKMLTPSIATKIPELVDIFSENVETDLTIPNLLWLAKAAVEGGLSPENVTFVTMPGNYNGYFWSYQIGHNESYVFPYAGEIVELVNEDFNPYLRDITKSDLDIMYKKSDGSIASTSGVVRDSRANSAYYASIAPKATPEPSETPEETGLPEGSQPPEATGSLPPVTASLPPDDGGSGQGGENTAAPSPSPVPSESPVPPESTAPGTEPPATQGPATESPPVTPDPVPTPALTPTPAPAPTDSPGQGESGGPPEGIPILP